MLSCPANCFKQNMNQFGLECTEPVLIKCSDFPYRNRFEFEETSILRERNKFVMTLFEFKTSILQHTSDQTCGEVKWQETKSKGISDRQNNWSLVHHREMHLSSNKHVIPFIEQTFNKLCNAMPYWLHDPKSKMKPFDGSFLCEFRKLFVQAQRRNPPANLQFLPEHKRSHCV